jgi:Pro-kumamolisin, activation domain/Subtilase family
MKPYLPTPLRRTIAIASSLALVSTVVAGSSASLAAGHRVILHAGNTVIRHEVLSSITNGRAVRLSLRTPGSPMTLSLGLPIRNATALDRFLATEGRSHGPMTHAQFDARFGATPAQVGRVLAWAKSYGLAPTYVSPDGLTINVAGTTRQAEAAFHTVIANYRLGSQYFYANTSNPVAPVRLGIQTVLGLTSVRDAHRIGLTQRQVGIARRQVVPQCPLFSQGADCYMPKQLRAAYDVSQHAGSGANQSVGFTLWGAPEVQPDFTTFAGATGDTKITICAVTTGNTKPAACNSKPNSIQFVEFDPAAANKDTTGRGETAMDIQYAHGIAPGIHMKYFLGGDGSDADLIAALSAAENDRSLHLISNSWGGDPPPHTTSSWLTHTTTIFKAADAVGTTFLFSTGDAASDSGCIGGPTLCGLPEYPAVSPYVLAVGGTDVQMNKGFTAWSSEFTWDNWQQVNKDSTTNKNVYSVEGGGSGCSTYFSRPAFQKGFPNLATNAGCKGRAIPDVSADGDPNNSGVLVVDGANGKQELTISAGTSLATPLWAGMMADTLNFEARKGIKPFWKTKADLAPELYKLAKTNLYHTYFHDVTCGYNGSPADKGWDQATGLGSPDWFALTQGIAGIAIASTGKAPTGCHLATSPAKTAEGNLGIPQSLWPKNSGKIAGGSQSETWLDTQSFFGQFKSRTYSSAGGLGNLAEQATVPIGSDTKNPFGLWLGTDYSSSIQADRVVKDTVTHAKSKFKLSFVDCSNGYSVEFPLAIPNNQDVLTPECQLLYVSLKDSQGNPWDAVYWIYAVGNTVGEMLFEAPHATVSASSNNTGTFFNDALNLAYSGAAVLYHATTNGDPGPLGQVSAAPAVRSNMLHRLNAAPKPWTGALPVGPHTAIRG